MPRTLVGLGLGLFGLFGLFGCTASTPGGSSDADAPAGSVRSPSDTRWLAVAAGYQDYGRVDDMNRWVPTLCRLAPGRARLSGASRRTPHGGKLFYLYAKDRASYVDPDRTESPAGQIIVKEAWVPEEATRAQRELSEKPVGLIDPDPAVGSDEKHYLPGEKSGLFVMMKLDPATDPETETDDGWVYATLDAKGETVIQAGKIAACMRCHREGTVDRLFGIKL